MNPAPNLFLIGPMGAGKTTIGRRVAARLGLPFFDLDQIIEQQSGVRVALIFEMEGEAGFRRRESTALAEYAARDGIVLATGGGAVLAEANRRLLHERGYVVLLQTSVEQQLRRLANDRKRPLLAAPDRRARLEALAAQRDPIYRELADLIFDPRSATVPEAAHALAGLLETRWQRTRCAA